MILPVLAFRKGTFKMWLDHVGSDQWAHEPIDGLIIDGWNQTEFQKVGLDERERGAGSLASHLSSSFLLPGCHRVGSVTWSVLTWWGSVLLQAQSNRSSRPWREASEMVSQNLYSLSLLMRTFFCHWRQLKKFCQLSFPDFSTIASILFSYSLVCGL